MRRLGSKSEIQPSRFVRDPLSRNGMHVTLTHEDVDLSGDLDLRLVVGVEEDPVTDLDGARVRTDRDDP